MFGSVSVSSKKKLKFCKKCGQTLKIWDPKMSENLRPIKRHSGLVFPINNFHPLSCHVIVVVWRWYNFVCLFCFVLQLEELKTHLDIPLDNFPWIFIAIPVVQRFVVLRFWATSCAFSRGFAVLQFSLTY